MFLDSSTKGKLAAQALLQRRGWLSKRLMRMHSRNTTRREASRLDL